MCRSLLWLGPPNVFNLSDLSTTSLWSKVETVSCSVVSDFVSPWTLACQSPVSMEFPSDKNTGVGSYSLQEILSQESNPGFPHYKRILIVWAYLASDSYGVFKLIGLIQEGVSLCICLCVILGSVGWVYCDHISLVDLRRIDLSTYSASNLLLGWNSNFCFLHAVWKLKVLLVKFLITKVIHA